eukprot:333965-Chlamydomonas_euryale.AAC.3
MAAACQNEGRPSSHERASRILAATASAARSMLDRRPTPPCIMTPPLHAAPAWCTRLTVARGAKNNSSKNF